MIPALLALWAQAADAPSLQLHPVRLPFESPRPLGMDLDADGFLWFGSTHRVVYRYDPRRGTAEQIKLPFDSSSSQCICVGSKVYLLGQTYPRLIIFDRASKKFSEAAYPSPHPDVWYATGAVDGRHLFLFDRRSAGVVKWDTAVDAGNVIVYPYGTPVPSGGRYVEQDRAVWCAVWDFAGGQYKPLGVARLDVPSGAFTGFFAFPAEEAILEPFSDPDATLFYPHTLRGRLVPFDFKARRWRRPLAVPRFGERFGFIGLGTVHEGRWYFSISTYNGTDKGCDGKPYHFCNGLLEFDPKTRRFAFPTLDVEGAYVQVAYTLSAGGRFFATGNDIREADGALNGGRTGPLFIWQSHPK
jgi:hypothetical protein